jgi:hypothetical protein
VAGIGRSDITPAPGTPQGGWGAQTKQRKRGTRPRRRADMTREHSLGLDARCVHSATVSDRGRLEDWHRCLGPAYGVSGFRWERLSIRSVNWFLAGSQPKRANFLRYTLAHTSHQSL